MAIIHLFDLWLMYALVRVADLLILIYSHFDLFFSGYFLFLLLLLFPSKRFLFSPQEFISNLDRHSDTMFTLICTLFMRKFRCQIIIVGPMTCTSVLCVCCACMWMLFFWFLYADRQSYNVNNIYCGVQSHRMLLVNTRNTYRIGAVKWWHLLSFSMSIFETMQPNANDVLCCGSSVLSTYGLFFVGVIISLLHAARLRISLKKFNCRYGFY